VFGTGGGDDAGSPVGQFAEFSGGEPVVAVYQRNPLRAPEAAISNSNEMLNASAFTRSTGNSRLPFDNQLYSYSLVLSKSKRTPCRRRVRQ